MYIKLLRARLFKQTYSEINNPNKFFSPGRLFFIYVCLVRENLNYYFTQKKIWFNQQILVASTIEFAYYTDNQIFGLSNKIFG